MTNTHRRGLLALTAAGLAMPGLLRASEAWPDRPIRLIVPWPPGGSTDTVARILQPRLQDVLGKPVVIDNRGGASGSIGAIEAARAPADGMSWMLAYDTQATNESVMPLPFRTLEAFVPVCLVATGPLALVAHASTPFHTYADVVAAAKKDPDSLNYATSGVGGLAHVATTLLQQVGGFRMVHVPYKGGGPATQDAVAGHVPLFMSNVVVISQHIKAGVLRPLGVTTREESRHVPGVKSFAQQGVGDFEAPTWWAMVGRTGTPQPILEKMNRALLTVLADSDVRRKLEEQGADVVGSSPEECGQFLEREIIRWGKVIRDNNIRADS
ncbi:tripartite tricarboxylate transporter substrate binding protein [Roseomonas marmotae]|uniref:Tripartite tricarboxylate transporter substrate binding protein n=1 Tax=Roseomonas marmotae TaxID=2768161 RepID=A0ABS3KGV2_9PROT|nr:tripartite tricarboxylate transporter substrate binding protein [Roseomonas marmotae]MBO1075561.1 tripartite tricarboxylate transporter substrate binding protein [Roseomonas marmotae]QTI79427.1 tripartite tricarboxylate transporter substrate binding protein [Roseomonas marmotae]